MLHIAWQTGATASWVGPVVAVSLVIIAIAVLGVTIAIWIAAFRLSRQAQELRLAMHNMQGEATDLLRAARRITEQGQELVSVIRSEAGAYAHTGRELRKKIEEGAERVEEKLHRLESLYDVVHDEVEDTALHLAATLRAARSGKAILNRIRHLFTSRR